MTTDAPTVVKLTAPAGAKRVQCGEISFGVEPDGTLSVYEWAVPILLAAGCTRVDGLSPTINVASSVAAANTPAEVATFIMSKGLDAAVDDDLADLKGRASDLA